MAGKKRRTRCEQCKRMFQYGVDGEVTHKLHSMYKTFRLNTLFCSHACLHEYTTGLIKEDKNE